MSEALELEAHDLAALLCSRVCHDVINPVGAITNGLEVLDEDGDEETRSFAFDLIRKSAAQASAKLQFARIAFGAAGSVGAEIDLADAENVARGLMAIEKPELTWEAPRMLLPKNQVKLLLNLLLLAVASIPRGGAINVKVAKSPDGLGLRLDATGMSARIPPAFDKLVPGDIAGLAIDAHMVQPYYAGLLARLSKMTVSANLEGQTVTIMAQSSV